MKISKTSLRLAVAFAWAAFSFSLAIQAQGQTVDLVYDFHNNGKQSAAVSMVQGTDGNLYGSAGGGAHDQGQIFRMTPSGDLTTIYSFCAKSKCPDGAIPWPRDSRKRRRYLWNHLRWRERCWLFARLRDDFQDHSRRRAHDSSRLLPTSGCADGQDPAAESSSRATEIFTVSQTSAESSD